MKQESDRRHTSCASRTSPCRGASACIRGSTSSFIFTLKIAYSYNNKNKIGLQGTKKEIGEKRYRDVKWRREQRKVKRREER